MQITLSLTDEQTTQLAAAANIEVGLPFATNLIHHLLTPQGEQEELEAFDRLNRGGKTDYYSSVQRANAYVSLRQAVINKVAEQERAVLKDALKLEQEQLTQAILSVLKQGMPEFINQALSNFLIVGLRDQLNNLSSASSMAPYAVDDLVSKLRAKGIDV